METKGKRKEHMKISELIKELQEYSNENAIVQINDASDGGTYDIGKIDQDHSAEFCNEYIDLIFYKPQANKRNK